MGFAIGGAVLASGVLSYAGSQQAAAGAQGAANDQLAQANANRNQALGYAQATPQELNILGQQYQAASQNLSQQQQLMNSIDPALMEASKQALAIMQGGSGAATQPMFALRNQQRAQLVQSLQSQYGPGAESTSIGQHALQQFDMQTQNMQTGQLGNMMGMAESGGGPGLSNALNNMNQVGQGYGNIQARLSNASLGTGNALMNSAGAGYVGQTLQGQGMASMGNNFMNAGTTLLGSMYGKGGGNTYNIGGTSGMNPAAGMQTQNLNMPTLGQSYSNQGQYSVGSGSGQPAYE